MRTLRLAAFASLTVALALAGSPASSTPGSGDTYLGGGNAVVGADLLEPLGITLTLPPGPVLGTLALKLDVDDSPLVDSGSVTCVKSKPSSSLGGGCVPFGFGDSILVTDAVAGTDVAFQVCLDHNGDGICSQNSGIANAAVSGCVGVSPTTSPECERVATQVGLPSGPCEDEIFFNHDDAGVFHNPLGPLPTSFKAGCPGGSWYGYVVLLCEGTHATAAPHVHPAVTGSITATTGGTGFGDFCGAPAPQGKVYNVA